jgi:hypothetical protein
VQSQNSSRGRLGSPYVLALLSQMTHDGLVCIRTVSGHVGVRDAVKGVAVAGLDGLDLCLLDKKTQAGMIKMSAAMLGRLMVQGSKGVLEDRATSAIA